MNKITCEFCGKITDRAHKSQHQKTKYCIGSRTTIPPVELKYNCRYCDRPFNRNDYLKKHENICKSKDLYCEVQILKEQLITKDVIINNLKNDNKRLQDEISKNNRDYHYYNYNNNITINAFNVNVDYCEILNRRSDLTLGHLSDIRKLAEYLIAGNKHKIVVVDKNTNTIGYFHDNKYIKDTKCRNLINNIGKIISPVLNELFYSNCRNYDREVVKCMYRNKNIIYKSISPYRISKNEKELIEHIVYYLSYIL